MKPDNWWPCFDAGTTDAEVRELAAAKLKVPEKHVEILQTGGRILAWMKQEDG